MKKLFSIIAQFISISVSAQDINSIIAQQTALQASQTGLNQQINGYITSLQTQLTQAQNSISVFTVKIAAQQKTIDSLKNVLSLLTTVVPKPATWIFNPAITDNENKFDHIITAYGSLGWDSSKMVARTTVATNGAQVGALNTIKGGWNVIYNGNGATKTYPLTFINKIPSLIDT